MEGRFTFTVKLVLFRAKWRFVYTKTLITAYTIVLLTSIKN